jgi:hypothetical protein
MPDPLQGENRNDFISRCIPIVIKDGTAEDSDQAVAVCNSMWEQAKKSEKPEEEKDEKSMLITTIKAVNDWTLDVLAIPFGGPNGGKDSQGEFFDKDTNFYFDKFASPMITYYHSYTPDGKPQGDPEVIGKAVGREVKEDGVWVRVMLDKASQYAKRVWEAAKQKMAAASSGTIEHIRRADLTGRIRHWPFVELALFDTGPDRQPANTYAVAIPAIKSIYEQAGRLWPEFLDDDPEAKAKGSDGQSAEAESYREIQTIKRAQLKAKAFLALED